MARLQERQDTGDCGIRKLFQQFQRRRRWWFTDVRVIFLYSIATTTSKTIWTLMTFDVWNKHFSGEQIGRASVTLNLFVHSFSTNWETVFGAKFKIYDFLRSPLAPPHNKNKSFSPNQLIGFPFTERERERERESGLLNNNEGLFLEEDVRDEEPEARAPNSLP